MAGRRSGRQHTRSHRDRDFHARRRRGLAGPADPPRRPRTTNHQSLPATAFYQCLLELNDEEASDIIERHASEQSTLAAFDDAVLPALRSIETDFRAGVLSDAARADACQILRQIIAELGEPRAAPDATAAPVLCIPASHEPDELATCTPPAPDSSPRA